MDTSKLRKFAQYARRYLMEQVAAKMKFVLAPDSQARRENPKAVAELDRQIRATSQDRVIERVAYIWFNRFCAIRFMDTNRYTRIGVLSPADGQFQPEILAEAKMGHIDDDLMPDAARQKVFNLLNGSISSRDPQQEAYHLLVVAACNFYNKTMPFMFEKIADYTEMLMPDDLLSGNSILAYTREAMTPGVCKDVEVIGWLYQFYISEKKDEVFEGLKKNKKITPENIPAATQLFTPHWIVRYLVENSLGRLWMLNRPNSKLIGQMDYYIKPETPETDFLLISKPEEIKLCDPACGSGHMLTYSYDILYAIYEEEGYDANDIPRLILENNLFGIEIDERAGELAAFALTMKAANGNPKDEKSNHRRFFRKPVQPNICILQNILFEEGELKSYMNAVGQDLFTTNLQTMLHQFREADNFGSLIRPEYADAASVFRKVEEKNLTSDLFLQNTHERVLLALKQANYLSTKYHVLVANPPYMGKGMNDRLKTYALDNYPNSRTDLFAMFVERCISLSQQKGLVSMITMQSWMFLSSFEKLRKFIINQNTILSMAHLGTRAFDSIGGKVVSTTAFVLKHFNHLNHKGSYLRLTDGNCESEKVEILKKSIDTSFKASSSDFNKVSGSPIAYWIGDNLRNAFINGLPFGELVSPRVGLQTGCNDKFIRMWYEISFNSIGFKLKTRTEAEQSQQRWFPYNKGGAWRKWFGNFEYVVDWENDGERIRNCKDEAGKLRSRPQNTEYYFKEGITWADITTNSFAARYTPAGSIFDVKGSSGFPPPQTLFTTLGLMNCNLMNSFMKVLNPTVTFQVGDMARVPYINLEEDNEQITQNVRKIVDIVRDDWDSSETSWDFKELPLITEAHRNNNLASTYSEIRKHWNLLTLNVQKLEEENNRIFIGAYGLKNELTPEVQLHEITLTCNPHYRYPNVKSEEERESSLLSESMKECHFSRAFTHLVFNPIHPGTAC